MRNGKDPIGEEMKLLERTRWNFQADASDNMYVRIDGKNFSSWTRKVGMKFADNDMLDAMAFATTNTAKVMNADVAYCQSDEASIGWFHWNNNEKDSQHIFDGKPQKINSVCVSTFTSHFLYYVIDTFCLNTSNLLPAFDARFVNMRHISDLQKMFYWRYLDCKRNAIQAFAQKKYSHKFLQGMPLKSLYENICNDGLENEFLELPITFREGFFYTAEKHKKTMSPDLTPRESLIEAFKVNS